MADLSQYTFPNDTPVCLLDCSQAFNGLTQQEQLYAHHLAQASFTGGLIVLVQTSPESPGIFLLLQKTFRSQSLQDLRSTALSNGVTEDEFQAFLVYAAAFYSNMGNYKSFGDTKFIPNMPQEKLEILVMNSAAAVADPGGVQSLWNSIKQKMFSLNDREKELGLGEKGITTYFSGNCDQRDAEIVQEFMVSKNLSPYNTRLFKTEDKETGLPVYEIRLASVEVGGGDIPGFEEKSKQILGSHKFSAKDVAGPVTINVSRGDYSRLLALVVHDLNQALKYAANDHERAMIKEYIKSFQTGSIPAHKEGSRFWIKNKGPIVETYIGFIESYRDPFGVRGEFEGFVAVVNKAMSAKFSALVEAAEHLLAHLPWPAEYEKDTFLRPDFTSLDVLAFGGSGIPAGINIPNYDDIRQNEGFKNVSLGNVLVAGYNETKVIFLQEKDKELFQKWKIPSFEVQVGLHELLGHGSGKLFMEDEKGKLNFDNSVVLHTETHEKITSWYKPGETWDSRFSTIASTYEECRAECVGIYLCLLSDVLKIFGHEGDDSDDIIYVNWLNMVRAGVMALEFYSPDTGAWRQAHMNARFVILRVMLEAGEGLVQINRITGEDGEPDLQIILDRSKITPVGKPAIGNFLRKLQVYKSTGDYENGKQMYDYYSDVSDSQEPHFLSLRTIVLARKQPRRMFVQHHTFIQDGKVELKSYEASAAGLIQSFVDRFPTPDIDAIVQELWDQDRPFF
ncbi:dipeptidyl peptidase 3-like [Pomacea canaliculata]|uniref:dipeptidyl peptidase 3-like n=1 Tax=Pomacea canaliculata TaxID=400727 RepID=UPI000D726192|nr:dipeptidyl peptidase 3-like [Pomacea canaliculata]XP_025104637.1 dipeptidyl peptidase 3-like [Pomacea canaliculata]XP_025104638.1 dipeptidyl peptidase 3-like [Pomacea canaliculata]XP_025104639.1 dipeptidyl peptidase 3-like [Pomacea canaliculata]